MSYDFNQVFTETFENGGSIAVNRSNYRLLHGLFGPKLALGHTNFHPFVTIKGGFVDAMFDAAPATLGTFVSNVQNLRDKNVMGSVYPGGGLEDHIGPIGLRFDVGDEIYFNGGTHNNFRATFGPYIRSDHEFAQFFLRGRTLLVKFAGRAFCSGRASAASGIFWRARSGIT